MSHPTWVRGLKLDPNFENILHLVVAPYVGAWIETPCLASLRLYVSVAPYVGAWIETTIKTR